MSILGDHLREARREQWDQARERFDGSAAARAAHERERQERGVRITDTVEELRPRVERLLQHNEAPPRVVVETALRETADERAALERIVGATNDMQPWNFLPRGARAATSVARISAVEGGRELPLGTGFLVSARLLMTNNHVLPDEGSAGDAIVEFAVELDVDQTPCTPVRYKLEPEAFFVTDQHLDMTLVLVRPAADGRNAGDRFGYNQLIREQGKIVNGENVNVVGHPMGRQKEISIRDNGLQLQITEFLQYLADTEPGNSGSPVYNDQWEVVALHHSGVPRKDREGRTLRKDGAVWRSGDGDDAIDWVANEGARVSVILKHLSGLDLPAAQAQVLRELGPEAGWPSTTSVATTVSGPARRRPRASASTPRAGRESVGVQGADPGDTHLVFLHGRSQPGMHPTMLRNSWVAGLNAGLTLGDLPPLAPRDVWFPYYGDRLVESAASLELPGPPRSRSYETAHALAPPDDAARAAYEQMIDQAASRAGMPDVLGDPDGGGPGGAEESLDGLAGLTSSLLQRRLSWLAGRSGLDEAVVAQVFSDVAVYLAREGVRDAVLDTVAETVPTSGSIVLVSHSLGTVVGMDMLSRLSPGVDVALLVTVGSPLGMGAVHNRLLADGPQHPERVQHWVNAWSAADAVSIGCPLRGTWGGSVQEIFTGNRRERAHDIKEYLSDVDVARHIGTALGHDATGHPG